MEVTRQIAIYIVETTKKIIETLLIDIEDKVSFRNMFPKIDLRFGEKKEERNFNLDLFDQVDEYYEDLVKYFNFHLYQFFEKKEKSDIKIQFDSSSFATIYFSILTDLLLDILKTHKESYKEDIIKCDITTLCQIFALKNEKLNYSHSFFYICVKELDEKYYSGKKLCNLPKNIFVEKMDEYYKNEAIKKINQMKSRLYDYIRKGIYDFNRCKSKEITNDLNETELDKYTKDLGKIKKLYEDFKANYETLYDNYEQLKAYCLDKDNNYYFSEYSKYLSKNLFIPDNIILNKYVLPFEIIEMELNDENSRFFYNIKELSKEPDIDNYNYSFYYQFENIKKEMDFALLKNYKEDILNIISKDDFINKFISILKSKPVSHYLKSKRVFDEVNEYDIEFINDDDYRIEDQNLDEQYEQLLKDIKLKGYNFFKNLIRIKGLAYKIPALTGPTMRIFLNPILKFSDIAIKDENQRNNILESALIILLIHEFAHLLTFYPVKNCYPKNTPITPKKRENGKCLIFYLFRKDVISNINNEQATLINDLNSWKNVEILRSILKVKAQGKKDKEEKEKEKEIIPQAKIGELDLYFSNEYESKSMKKTYKKTEYCVW